MAITKIFCIPYAGGSAGVYQHWNRYSGKDIDVIPLELAGRGRRINEVLYADELAAVDDIFNIVVHHAERTPYAIFGHSMGAMLCYKVTQKLTREGVPPPIHIFCSGRNAPHLVRKNEKIYHLLNDEEFKYELLKLGGTPPELFDHPQLLELFLPVLRNDFRISETFGIDESLIPLDINITVIVGKDDSLTDEESDGWRLHTSGQYFKYAVDGGHFFLNQQPELILEIIKKRLSTQLRA